MRWAMLVVAVLAGCGAYQVAASPGASGTPARSGNAETDTMARDAVGCVQVGVDRRADRDVAPVVRYAVANRCDRAIEVDLGWATVIGRTAEGAELALIPVEHAVADGRARATVAPHGVHEATVAYAATAPIGQLCVDVATIAAAQAEAPPRGQWRCFGNVVSVTMR